MTKTITIGETTFELPFRYENYHVVDDIEQTICGVCCENQANTTKAQTNDYGKTIADALNLWTQEKNRYEVVDD